MPASKKKNDTKFQAIWILRGKFGKQERCGCSVWLVGVGRRLVEKDGQEKQGNRSPKAERTGGRPCADHVAGPVG
jgi:hypothetical protein